jgi:prolyl 4-hydroxylase
MPTLGPPSKIAYDFPALTETGHEIGKLDPQLHQKLREFHKTHRAVAESIPNFIKSASSQLIELTDPMKAELHRYFLPICRTWIQDQYQLNPTFVYGVRTYLRGAWLKEHRDRQATHHVSAIVQIDQQVDEDWPLYIENKEGQWDQVILKPGDYVLYESARMEHGRQVPLSGRSYTNCFVHYSLGEKKT